MESQGALPPIRKSVVLNASVEDAAKVTEFGQPHGKIRSVMDNG